MLRLGGGATWVNWAGTATATPAAIAHPSSIALNFVSQLAATKVKVVLTGEGSDETLAGYNRYRVTLLNLALGRRYEQAVPASMRRAVRSALEALPATWRTRRRLGGTTIWRASGAACRTAPSSRGRSVGAA